MTTTHHPGRSAARSARIIDTLMAERAAGHLEYRGIRDGVYLATVRGRRREYELDRMAAWLDGYEDGSNGGRLARPAEHPVGSLYRLLADPAAVDARRLRVLTAMRVRGLGVAAAAELIGRRRESVRNALRFGRPVLVKGRRPTLDVLEEVLADPLVTLYGQGWADIPSPGELRGASDADPEPVEFRRARSLLHAHMAGLVEFYGPLVPDHVRRATSFRVGRGDEPFTMSARLVVPWVQGLADGAGDDAVAEAVTDRRNLAHHVDDLPAFG